MRMTFDHLQKVLETLLEECPRDCELHRLSFELNEELVDCFERTDLDRSDVIVEFC